MQVEIIVIDREFYSWDSGNDDDSNVGTDLPSYATSGSAAVDLYATDYARIEPGNVVSIPTGIAIYIADPNIVGIINPRSGWGSERGLILANTQGWIDSDYQGQIFIKAWNRSTSEGYTDEDGFMRYAKTIDITPGDRIAQLMFVPVQKVQWKVVEKFSQQSTRGQKGFGSTGV